MQSNAADESHELAESLQECPSPANLGMSSAQAGQWSNHSNHGGKDRVRKEQWLVGIDFNGIQYVIHIEFIYLGVGHGNVINLLTYHQYSVSRLALIKLIAY